MRMLLVILFVSSAMAAPRLPGPIDSLHRSELWEFAMGGVAEGTVALRALDAHVAKLDEAERANLVAAVGYLAETCPYNRAVLQASAVLRAALPELRRLAPGRLGDLEAMVEAQQRLLVTLQLEPLPALPEGAWIRGIGAAESYLAVIDGGPGDVEATRGLFDEQVKPITTQLGAAELEGIRAAGALANQSLAGAWPLKAFAFVYTDRLKEAASQARAEGQLAFAARAEALSAMLQALTRTYC